MRYDTEWQRKQFRAGFKFGQWLVRLPFLLIICGFFYFLLELFFG